VSNRYHLAQLNVARMVAPLDDALMDGFVARLDEINKLADESPGFVWRLQSEDGDATSIRAFPDDLMLVNMSVWESVQALRAYVYSSEHKELLRSRGDWFSRMAENHLVMWWLPAGQEPTLEEAKRRLAMLRSDGPSSEAFTFRDHFEAP